MLTFGVHHRIFVTFFLVRNYYPPHPPIFKSAQVLEMMQNAGKHHGLVSSDEERHILVSKGF